VLRFLESLSGTKTNLLRSSVSPLFCSLYLCLIAFNLIGSRYFFKMCICTASISI
jgi:hypothetical protein